VYEYERIEFISKANAGWRIRSCWPRSLMASFGVVWCIVVSCGFVSCVVRGLSRCLFVVGCVACFVFLFVVCAYFLCQLRANLFG
jgi:hypothetical protein